MAWLHEAFERTAVAEHELLMDGLDSEELPHVRADGWSPPHARGLSLLGEQRDPGSVAAVQGTRGRDSPCAAQISCVHVERSCLRRSTAAPTVASDARGPGEFSSQAGTATAREACAS